MNCYRPRAVVTTIDRAEYDRQETRRQASAAAVRCLLAAVWAYWRGDEVDVQRWMAHVEKLAAVFERPS